jgi:hypothetical protein
MGLFFAAVAYGDMNESMSHGMFFGGIGMVVLAAADMLIRALVFVEAKHGNDRKRGAG